MLSRSRTGMGVRVTSRLGWIGNLMLILLCFTSLSWCYSNNNNNNDNLEGVSSTSVKSGRDRSQGKGRSSSSSSFSSSSPPSSSSSSSSSPPGFSAKSLALGGKGKGNGNGNGGGGGKYGLREDLSMSMSNGNGNGLNGLEPSCEELRAMWRYYKRQSRAELTNEIPAFEPVLFPMDFPMSMSMSPVVQSRSFRSGGGTGPGIGNGNVGNGGMDRDPSYGALKHFRSQHSRARSKSSRYGYGYGHGYGQYPFGTLNYFGSPRQLRPMEQVMLQRPPKPVPADVITEPKVHYIPTPQSAPPTPSSLQQIQKMIVEERQRNGELPASSGTATEFGKVVLSPPQGQDGRVANKPKALMTPFEIIRFGLDGISNTKRGLFYYPIRPSRVREPQNQQANQSPKTTTTTTTTTTTPRPNLPQAPIPSVFSFWRRQLLPQDPPATLMMDSIERVPPPLPLVSALPTCSMVQGLQCSVNTECECQGRGLYRCHQGLCQFLALFQTVEDEDTSRGSWHTGPIDETELGVWEQDGTADEPEQQNENDENVNDSPGDNDE